MLERRIVRIVMNYIYQTHVYITGQESGGSEQWRQYVHNLHNESVHAAFSSLIKIFVVDCDCTS